MEVRSFPAVQAKPRAKTAIVAAAAMALGCTTASFWDSRQLRETAAAARGRLAAGGESERWQAVTVLLRDTRQTVTALQEAARTHGPEAAEAQRALDQLRELLR